MFKLEPDRRPDIIVTLIEEVDPMPTEDELRAELDKARDEAIKLRSDLSKLKEDLSYAQGESRDRKLQLRELQKSLEDTGKQRDEFKDKAFTGSGEWQAKVESLQAEVRNYRHRDVYAKVAKELKVSDPAKVADLITVAGYRPEGDEPDEGKIKDAFSKAVEHRSWLVDAQSAPEGAKPVPAGTNGAAPQSAPPAFAPGPGADRGQTAQPQPTGQPSPRPLGRL